MRLIGDCAVDEALVTGFRGDEDGVLAGVLRFGGMEEEFDEEG